MSDRESIEWDSLKDIQEDAHDCLDHDALDQWTDGDCILCIRHINGLIETREMYECPACHYAQPDAETIAEHLNDVHDWPYKKGQTWLSTAIE